MKDQICDWMFNLSRGPEKWHSTENLVDILQIPFLYVQREVCLALQKSSMYGRGLGMLHKESSIVSSFCIQFVAESDYKKNPALLFYHCCLAGLCVLHNFYVNILATILYCILF